MWANSVEAPFILPLKHAALFHNAAAGFSEYADFLEDAGDDETVFERLTRGQSSWPSCLSPGHCSTLQQNRLASRCTAGGLYGPRTESGAFACMVTLELQKHSSARKELRGRSGSGREDGRPDQGLQLFLVERGYEFAADNPATPAIWRRVNDAHAQGTHSPFGLL
jgi:hypothetical protein